MCDTCHSHGPLDPVRLARGARMEQFGMVLAAARARVVVAGDDVGAAELVDLGAGQEAVDVDELRVLAHDRRGEALLADLEAPAGRLRDRLQLGATFLVQI